MLNNLRSHSWTAFGYQIMSSVHGSQMHWTYWTKECFTINQFSQSNHWIDELKNLSNCVPWWPWKTDNCKLSRIQGICFYWANRLTHPLRSRESLPCIASLKCENSSQILALVSFALWIQWKTFKVLTNTLRYFIGIPNPLGSAVRVPIGIRRHISELVSEGTSVSVEVEQVPTEPTRWRGRRGIFAWQDWKTNQDKCH